MKNFALLFALVSMVANAEVIYEGRFGTEGSTGESSPAKDSVKSAAAIHKALKVKSAGDGSKTVQISDESNLSCKEPYQGASRLEASCTFILRESQKVKVKKGSGFTGDVSFSGELATKIHSVLPTTGSRRVGASVKNAGKLECSKPARPSSPATCTILKTNVLKIDTEA